MIPASQYSDVWQDPGIPHEQRKVWKPELESWLAGKPVAPFDAFRSLIAPIAAKIETDGLLEVGSASAYYSAVLKSFAPAVPYLGCDISLHMLQAAREWFPGVVVIQASSEALPFPEDRFELVVLSGMIQHVADYRPSIREAVRASSRFVMLHRVMASIGLPDHEHLNAAYGVEFPQKQVDEPALLAFCESLGLRLVDAVRWGDEKHFNASYLLMKSAHS